MMPLIFIALFLCALAFLAYTAMAIIMGVFAASLYRIGLGGGLLAIGSVLLWLLSCRGMVLGLNATLDPTFRRSMIVAGHAALCWLGLVILFGGLW